MVRFLTLMTYYQILSVNALILNDLLRFEKLLATFHYYTFDHYAVLQLTLTRIYDFIDRKPATMDNQTQLDFAFEIEHEAELLKGIRHSNNRNEDFEQRVKAALHIINRLKPYVAQAKEVNPKAGRSFWKKLKRQR